MTWKASRTRLVATVLVALAAIASVALAQPKSHQRQQQPKLRFNGKDNPDLSHNAVRVKGHVMAPARPFFNQFGANIERKGDWYTARHGDHEFRFRPGSRVYYDNDRPYYFQEAPFERNGTLLLSIGDLTVALGGRYDWDDRYQRGNIWYGPVAPVPYPMPVPGGGYYPAPPPVRQVVPLRIMSPKNYGRVSAQAVVVTGYAAPYTDIRILVNRVTRNGEVRVFETPARVEASGQWAMRLPMYGGGTYTIQVQQLDAYRHSVDSKRIVVYAG